MRGLRRPATTRLPKRAVFSSRLLSAVPVTEKVPGSKTYAKTKAADTPQKYRRRGDFRGETISSMNHKSQRSWQEKARKKTTNRKKSPTKSNGSRPTPKETSQSLLLEMAQLRDQIRVERERVLQLESNPSKALVVSPPRKNKLATRPGNTNLGLTTSSMKLQGPQRLFRSRKTLESDLQKTRVKLQQRQQLLVQNKVLHQVAEVKLDKTLAAISKMKNLKMLLLGTLDALVGRMRDSPGTVDSTQLLRMLEPHLQHLGDGSSSADLDRPPPPPTGELDSGKTANEGEIRALLRDLPLPFTSDELERVSVLVASKERPQVVGLNVPEQLQALMQRPSSAASPSVPGQSAPRGEAEADVAAFVRQFTGKILRSQQQQQRKPKKQAPTTAALSTAASGAAESGASTWSPPAAETKTRAAPAHKQMFSPLPVPPAGRGPVGSPQGLAARPPPPPSTSPLQRGKAYNAAAPPPPEPMGNDDAGGMGGGDDLEDLIQVALSFDKQQHGQGQGQGNLPVPAPADAQDDMFDLETQNDSMVGEHRYADRRRASSMRSEWLGGTADQSQADVPPPPSPELSAAAMQAPSSSPVPGHGVPPGLIQRLPASAKAAAPPPLPLPLPVARARTPIPAELKDRVEHFISKLSAAAYTPHGPDLEQLCLKLSSHGRRATAKKERALAVHDFITAAQRLSFLAYSEGKQISLILDADRKGAISFETLQVFVSGQWPMASPPQRAVPRDRQSAAALTDVQYMGTSAESSVHEFLAGPLRQARKSGRPLGIAAAPEAVLHLVRRVVHETKHGHSGRPWMVSQAFTQLYKSMDTNRDDRVNFAELRIGLQTALPHIQAAPITYEALFEVLDRRQAGYISLEDFSALRTFGGQAKARTAAGPAVPPPPMDEPPTPVQMERLRHKLRAEAYTDHGQDLGALYRLLAQQDHHGATQVPVRIMSDMICKHSDLAPGSALQLAREMASADSDGSTGSTSIVSLRIFVDFLSGVWPVADAAAAAAAAAVADAARPVLGPAAVRQYSQTLDAARGRGRPLTFALAPASLRELAIQFLKNLCRHARIKSVGQLYAACDAARDEKITLGELQAGAVRFGLCQEGSSDELRALFDTFDTTGNRHLRLPELKAAIRGILPLSIRKLLRRIQNELYKLDQPVTLSFYMRTVLGPSFNGRATKEAVLLILDNLQIRDADSHSVDDLVQFFDTNKRGSFRCEKLDHVLVAHMCRN